MDNFVHEHEHDIFNGNGGENMLCFQNPTAINARRSTLGHIKGKTEIRLYSQLLLE